MNLNFFAAAFDQRAVLDFLFESTDIRVFEHYSAYGAELREFQSTAASDEAFGLGVDAHGNGLAVRLCLWSPSVMERLAVERITLDPRRCEGHTFRYRIAGGGLMQLYFGGVHDRVLTKSHFGHQREKRARAWNSAEGVNWDALKTISNRVGHHVRQRLAVAAVQGCPVLREAGELADAGYALKYEAGTPWEYEMKPQRSPRE